MDCKEDGLSVSVLTEYKKFTKKIDRLKSCVVLNTPHKDVSSLPKKKIVFVLDTSDSMTDHISVLKQIMEKVVSCALGNTIGIVAFDDKARVICPLRELTSLDKLRTIKEELQKLKAHGFTNLYDGLELGLKVLWENPTIDDRRFLVLLTDGAANIPPRKTDDILTRLKLIPFTHRTDIYPIALGTNVNQDLLLKLAEQHHGRIYDLKSPSELFQSFGDCMGSILSVLMTNVEVKITTDCLLIVNGVYRLLQPCIIELGTLFVNDTRDILLTFEHVDTTNPFVATIEVTYVDDKQCRRKVCKEIRIETDATLNEQKLKDQHEKLDAKEKSDNQDIDSALQCDLANAHYIRQQELRLEVSLILDQLYQATTTKDISKHHLQTKIQSIRNEIINQEWDEKPLCKEILAILNQIQNLDSFRCRSLSMGLKSQRQTSLDNNPTHDLVIFPTSDPATSSQSCSTVSMSPQPHTPSHVTCLQRQLANDFKENASIHRAENIWSAENIENVENIEKDASKVKADDFTLMMGIERPKRQITIVDEMYKKPKSIESTEKNTQSPPYCIIN